MQIAHSAEYGSCKITKSLTPSFENKYLANCDFVPPGYLSGQSLVQNPQFKLIELVIPSVNPEDESARVTFDEPIEYDFDSDYGCETIECFDNLDHIDILKKENPEFFEKIFNSLKNKDSFKIDEIYVFNEMQELELNSASPIFDVPPAGIDSLFTEVIDIDAHSYIIYDGTIDEPLLKWKPKSEEYLELFGDKEYVLDSNGNKIFINENTILDNENLNNTDEYLSEPDVTIDNFEYGREVDSLDQIKFIRDSIAYTITPISESSNGTRFLLSDGKSKIIYESIDYILLEDHESISEISFDESGINLVDIFGIPYTLDAKVLSDNSSVELAEDPVSIGCLEALSSYVNNKDFSHGDLESFLKIQSNLTLHRLSWAQIKSTAPKKRLEQKILKLLTDKYEMHPEISKEFDTINIKSRNFLAKALPLVYEELNLQYQASSIESEPYKINVGDLKMLEILSSYEELDAEGNWDHRQFESNNKKNSIANFTSLINSAYLYSDNRIKTQNDVTKNQNFLKEKLSELDLKLSDTIKNIIFNSCVDQQGLSCKESISEVNNIFDNHFDQIYGVLLNQLSNYKDEDFITNIKFGHIWPKVKK